MNSLLFKWLIPSFIFLSACAQHQDIVIDDNDLLKNISFKQQGLQAIETNWWVNFEDDHLARYINRALTDNLDLKAAQLRAKSSEISAEIAGVDLYPTLNLNSNATSKFDEFGELSSSSVGLSASWEIDIWGEIAANIEKAYWANEGQQALLRARANLVVGSVSNAWFSLVSEKNKQQVLKNQHQRTSLALQVINRRFALGKNSITDIWQQERLLKSIEVQQAKNSASIYIHRQTLALWLGIPEQALPENEQYYLPELPPLPLMGLPAEILKYRPDIQRAYADINNANEALAVAIADQYPRITLRATYGSVQNDLQSLFDDFAGSLIASLAMPLFDAGLRRSVVEQRKLLLKALIFDYQQVWLEAIAKINQALVNETQLLKVSDNLELQLALANKTEKLTSVKYLQGKTNYLNLLKAQESILALERQYIDAKKNIMVNRIILYRELSQGRFTLNQENEESPSDEINQPNQYTNNRQVNSNNDLYGGKY